jgi:hypothetical protein
MLYVDQTNRVTFNVNVMGTAATPSCRCVVGESPALMFPAVKLSGDEWEVTIDLPSDFREGAHPFKIEVLINGRIFTPINHSISVGFTEAPVQQEPTITLAPAPMPAPMPEPTIALTQPPAPAPAPAIAVSPPVPAPVLTPAPSQVPAAPISLLKSVLKVPEERKPAEIATPKPKSKRLDFKLPVPVTEHKVELDPLEIVKSAPVPRSTKLEQLAVLPPKIKAAPPKELKITMTEVAASVADTKHQPKTVFQPATPKVGLLKLEEGEIVYEDPEQ